MELGNLNGHKKLLSEKIKSYNINEDGLIIDLNTAKDALNIIN